MATILGFEIHHIFPTELYDDPDLGTGLTNLFAGTDNPLLRDIAGNKMALFSNEATANAVQAAISTSSFDFLSAGFGGSRHNGSHPGYSNFIITEATDILNNSSLNNFQKQTAFYDLHRFASDLSKGLVNHNGAILGVMGDASYSQTLTNAWNARRVDPTAIDARSQNGLANYITGLNSTVTNSGLSTNVQERLNRVGALTNLAFQQNILSQERFSEITNILDHAATAMNNGGILSNIHASNLITSAGIKASYHIADHTGIGDSSSLNSRTPKNCRG